MLKVKIEDINTLSAEGKKADAYFIGSLRNFKEYIEAQFCPNLNLKLNLLLDLVMNGNDPKNSFIVFDSNCVIEALCRLLNVPYYDELEEEAKLDYYMAQFTSRMSELSQIRSETELLSKFRAIYMLYKEKKEKIEVSAEACYSYARVIPKRDAERLVRRKIYSANIKDSEYQELLAQYYTFNFATFMQTIYQDLYQLVTYLPFIIGSLGGMSVYTSQIKELDQKKIAFLVENTKKKAYAK